MISTELLYEFNLKPPVAYILTACMIAFICVNPKIFPMPQRATTSVTDVGAGEYGPGQTCLYLSSVVGLCLQLLQLLLNLPNSVSHLLLSTLTK